METQENNNELERGIRLSDVQHVGHINSMAGKSVLSATVHDIGIMAAEYRAQAMKSDVVVLDYPEPTPKTIVPLKAIENFETVYPSDFSIHKIHKPNKGLSIGSYKFKSGKKKK